MAQTTFTQSEAFTAMCLWEDVVEHGGGPWKAYRDANGTGDLRDMVLAFAKPCEAAWNAMSQDEQDDAGAFDWEFCPKWLREGVDWSGPIPAVKMGN